MDELDLHYPPETCPFCTIASAFPAPTPTLWSSKSACLSACIPSDKASDPEKTSPSSFVVLASKDVVAFLDILPMTGGHLLVTSRKHKVKVADLGTTEGREIGTCV